MMNDPVLSSFKNAGGTIHNQDDTYGNDYDKGGFGLETESPKNTEENKIKFDPDWQTNEKFNRWIIVEAGAKKHLPQPIQTVPVDQIQSLNSQHKKKYNAAFGKWAEDKEKEREK
jgi:hypothetical protein